MPLTAITIEGYRSVRKIRLPIDNLSVFVGGNGVGKTNLYNALALLRAAADGSLTRAVAAEGGFESVLWAGTRQRGKPVRLILTAHFEDAQYGVEMGLSSYEIELGIRTPTEAAFLMEPLIKEERFTLRHRGREVTMMERKRSVVTLRNADGARETHTDAVLPSETALAAFRDAARFPELEIVRRELQDWRLYHDFRTDADSSIRKPCHAITTPTLSSDGHDLAAVLATLFIVRQDTVDLERAIEDAFPGASLSASDNQTSWCEFGMSFAEMPKRVFGAHELSDGTLKYLCLLGALMGYRLPSLIALNEPEASLHPDLLPPLARLIDKAAKTTRVWIVTHSHVLADALRDQAGATPRTVIKESGATTVEGLRPWGEYKDDDDE